MKKILFPVVSIFLFCQFSTGFADDEGQIWSRLKNGGLVVLMRHASVDVGKGVGNPLLRDPTCLKERNLSEKGKKEAARIGEIFRARKIPVEDVLASPYCRTSDTAKIAFNRVHPVEFLSLLEVLPQEQADVNSEILSNRIGSFDGNGNLILITHEPNIRAVSFETVEKGAFLVLLPAGGDEFEELGIIRSGD